MNRLKPKIIYFIVIDRNSIKTFIFFDLVLGSGLYSVLKIMTSSIIAATVGSVLGTEGIKRIK